MSGSIRRLHPIAPTIPSRSCAGTTRSPIARGCRPRAAAPSGCRLKRNGRRRARGGLDGQTVSLGRSARSQHGEFPDRLRRCEIDAGDDALPHLSAERLRPLRHGGERLGVGPGLARAATTTRPRRSASRPVRARGRCGFSAAAAGSSPTSGCCPAAIATRCRPIHTRTGSGSGWHAMRNVLTF